MTTALRGTAPRPVSELSRRRFVGMVGGSGVALLAGCGGGGGSGTPPPETPPSISTQPLSQTAALGAVLTFSVTANGTNLSYRWQRNGVDIAGANGANLAVTVAAADAGAQYTVVVSNAAGLVQSQTAVLTLLQNSGVGLSLLAGGLGGSGMLEGRGTQARLSTMRQVVANKNGTVYFSGARMGKISAAGDVAFLPDYSLGSSFASLDMACDSRGDLYVIGNGAHVIHKLVNGAYVPYVGAEFVSGNNDGVGTAARLNGPLSPAFDSQDNLYFIDSGNYAVRKVARDGTVSLVAGRGSPVIVDGKGGAAGFESARSLLVLADDSLLVIDGNIWRKVLPDGTVTTLVGTVPYDIWAVQGSTIDSLYTLRGHGLVKLALDGSTTLIAGDIATSGYAEGTGSAARFNLPLSLALSANGQLFVADIQNSMIRKVDLATGEVSAWAGLASQPGRIDGEGAQARFADMGPSCVDANGNVYVVDTQAKTLRKIAVAGSADAPGVVSTLFTNFPSEGDVAVDTAGNFYGVRERAIIKVLPSGAQQVFAGQPGVLGLADGLGSTASFARPRGLMLDSAGNLYVADEPDEAPISINTYRYTYGGTLRMITPSGLVSTVAGTPGRTGEGVFGPPPSLGNDASYFAGHVHLASGTNGVIWVVSDYGIRRVGGTVGAPVWIVQGSHVSDNRPCASDGAGGLWVADGKFIRKVLPDGTSSVMAGVEDSRIVGVRLGALPGSLGQITSLVATGSNVLYCGSENAVIRIQLS